MKRLLIVEDETALRNVYTKLFRLHGFEVHEAANGKEAIKLMKAIKPDVVILDALMPVMGGIEFLRVIKIKENYPNTRVLLLSNLSVPQTVSQSKALGADKYLLKASVSPTELVAAIIKLSDQ
jgi:CheY-like chemotaxis protein